MHARDGAARFLRDSEQPTFLIETDTSAPDVWKTYRDDIENQCVDLEQKDGWLEMVDIIGGHAQTTIAINTKAANQAGLRRFGGLLLEPLRQRKRKLVVFWVIDRKRDRLGLLGSFLGTLAQDERVQVQVHVVRNLYWGEEGKFDMYNTSELRKEIEQRGGKTLNFPDVADRVAEAINKDRMPIHKAAAELSFGSQIELLRWQGDNVLRSRLAAQG